MKTAKKQPNNKNIVGTILVGLSEVFDSIPHDLLIAELHVYRFSENTLVFINKYRKQGVKINDTEIVFGICQIKERKQ